MRVLIAPGIEIPKYVVVVILAGSMKNFAMLYRLIRTKIRVNMVLRVIFFCSD